MEFMTVSSIERKIREKYKETRNKAENVFMLIDPPFSQRTATSKLSDSKATNPASFGFISNTPEKWFIGQWKA